METTLLQISFDIAERLEKRINRLSDEAKIELTALAWVGADSHSAEDFDWSLELELAKDNLSAGTANYLSGKPLNKWPKDGMKLLRSY